MGLEEFVKNFGYETRKEMKASVEETARLLMEGRAVLVDIRFEEEYRVWNVQPSVNIPLNELPKRWREIDTSKVVITACPHKDRAIIAMTYLREKGIPAKYLDGGLVGLVELLRADKAKEFFERTQK
ncbi:MAG TPA: rhodanese-like domain-containing protein [Aquificales bacterium]|nr:rhodanese-like domain-containing protein [Aquificales bacterium]